MSVRVRVVEFPVYFHSYPFRTRLVSCTKSYIYIESGLEGFELYLMKKNITSYVNRVIYIVLVFVMKFFRGECTSRVGY